MTSLQVSNCCFRKTEELKLIGLSQLERVVIGKSSFRTEGYDPDENGMNPNRHFYLKDCPKVKELRMGRKSFVDYSVCEIENLPSLEVIEIGKLNEGSVNFWFASLELKSDSERIEMMNRLAQFEITSIRYGCV